MNIAVFGLGLRRLGDLGVSGLAGTSRDRRRHLRAAKSPAIRSGRSPIVERDLPRLIAESVSAETPARHHRRSRRPCASADRGARVRRHAEPRGRLARPRRTPRTRRGEVGAALSGRIPTTRGRVPQHHAAGQRRDVLVPAHRESSSGIARAEDFGVVLQPRVPARGHGGRRLLRRRRTPSSAPTTTASAAPLAELYGALRGRGRSASTVRTAEMLKYVNNAFHGLKVAFANEVGTPVQARGHRLARGHAPVLHGHASSTSRPTT